MSSLVDAWRTYITQVRDWLAGTSTGGPGSDGSYPLTDDMGTTIFVPSPAAQAARVDAVVDSAQSYATAADTSAAAAATSAMNAAASESTAGTHRDDAQTSANTAQMYATTAGNNAADARTAATDSQTARDAAAASAASLDAAVTAAEDSATAAHNSEVASAASATASDASATSAAGSATDAYASALTAQTYATGVLRYMGAFDASTGSFPANPTKGDFWKISVAGTVGGVDLAVGDQIVYSGTGWDKIDNTETVTAVAGRVGNVVISIADLAGLQTTLDAKATRDAPLFTGTVSVAQEIACRTGALVLGTGVGSGINGTVYIRPDGTGGNAGSLNVSVGGINWNNQTLWHAGNFTPSSKVSSAPGYVTSDANALVGTTPTVIAAPSTNTPQGSWTTLLQVTGFSSNDRAFQLATSWSDATGNLYYRTNGSGAGFGAWRTVWDSSNFNPANYATLSGPTFSTAYFGGDPNNGGEIAWNVAQIEWGEMSFINSKGGGGGGFAWYNRANAASALGSPIMTLGSAGNLAATTIAPNNTGGAYFSGNGYGIQWNGVAYLASQVYQLSANGSTWVRTPRIFVQSNDPGANAADGDLWFW